MILVPLPPEFGEANLTILREDCSALPVLPHLVCVMSRIDHGKTSFLNTLRKSNVTASKYGSITHEIEVLSVNPAKCCGEQSTMTFFSTPGHSVIGGERLSGVLSTDMILLVVTADNGIQLQTIELVEQAV